MDCKDIDKILEKRLNGNLNKSSLSEIMDHAKVCESCRDKLHFEEFLTKFSEVVKNEKYDFSNNFNSKIMSTIKSKNRISHSPVDRSEKKNVLWNIFPNQIKYIAASILVIIGCFLFFSVSSPKAKFSKATKKIIPVNKNKENSNIQLEKQKGTILVSRLKNDIWNNTTIPIETIFSGDKLKLSRKSKATLKFPSGSMVVLSENTIVRIKESSIFLGKGKAWFHIRQTGSSFKVITPAVTIGVIGTKFKVLHNKKVTKVFVTKGKVKLTSKSETVFLIKNDFASINQITGKISKNKKNKKNKTLQDSKKLTFEVEMSIPYVNDTVTTPIITETSETKEIVILSTSDSKIIGDIDANGVINEIDSGLLQQYLISRNSFDESQKLRADVDKNGKLDRMDHMKLKIFCEKKYDLDQNGTIDKGDMLLLKRGTNIDINHDGKIDKRDELTIKSMLLQAIPNYIGTKIKNGQ
ncbi:FecR domain-containing protein [bacterium]|nr:FecR domain-containing protein [Bacteroidales bacterium]MCK5685890.1 FecR domain-containing protein [bacterium]